MIHSLFGITVLVILCWAISENRKTIPWRLVAGGLGLQLVLALLLLKFPPAHVIFDRLNDGVEALQAATQAGTSFVFGYLGGGEAPFVTTQAGSTFIFAFQALPLVLVISALSALLYYWRILPAIVKGFAWVLRRSMGIGGAAGMATVANIFVGMVEAPLFIKPYMERLSRSALFMVMVSGMATISGTVLVLYATILSGTIPDAAGHLLTASLISAPAALMVAGLMIPPAEKDDASVALPPSEDHNAMEALVKGTSDGLQLLLHIIALLVVLVSLVALANQIIGLFPDIAGEPLSLQRMLGWIMAPVAWLMGIPWAEASSAGSLLGTKTILNELIAYADMAAMPAGTLSERSELIMTYALCGFANFGSLAIMIGGLGTLCPSRRPEVIELGIRSIIGGTLATCLTGAVVGLIA
jgi:CNT family concentrative nucleoside transporter